MQKILIVVDMQNDFIDGALDTPEGKNLPVPHCIRGTYGWEISPALVSLCKEVPVIVDSACCAGVTPKSHKNALRAMEMCQVKVE